METHSPSRNSNSLFKLIASADSEFKFRDDMSSICIIALRKGMNPHLPLNPLPISDREKSYQEIFYNNMRDVWEYWIREHFLESKPTNLERIIHVSRAGWEISSKTTMNSLLTQHGRKRCTHPFQLLPCGKSINDFCKKNKILQRGLLSRNAMMTIFLSHTAKTSKTSLQKSIGPIF